MKVSIKFYSCLLACIVLLGGVAKLSAKNVEFWGKNSLPLQAIPVNETISVNFSRAVDTAPEGFIQDSGAPFGLRASGETYGWVDADLNTPLDISANARNRGIGGVSVEANTILHMQYGDVAGPNGILNEGVWEMDVPNGNYSITIAAGDGGLDGAGTVPRHTIRVEGVTVIDNYTPFGARGTATRFISGSASVTVSDGRITMDAQGGFNTKVASIKITRLTTFDGLAINFSRTVDEVPEGYIKDDGAAFGIRESGNTYGWLNADGSAPLDLSINTRNRSNTSVSLIQNTLTHIQYNDVAGPNGVNEEGIWELVVPNGTYEVTVGVGDEFVDGAGTSPRHTINAENVTLVSNFIPTGTAGAATRFTTAQGIVVVNDGRLTIDAKGGFNTKINSILISPVDQTANPYVSNSTPSANSTAISPKDFQSTVEFVVPDGYTLDVNTLVGNINLYEVTPSGEELLIPTNSNDTGGGDAITLSPFDDLKEFTNYLVRLTSGVEVERSSDADDRLPFLPFVLRFSTGTNPNVDPVIDLSDIVFTKVPGGEALGEGTSAQRFSSLAIGPDRKLYASTIGDFQSDGKIYRWDINGDGTLANLEILSPALSASIHPVTGVASTDNRLIIGFVFDPIATADNLIAYITHSAAALNGGPEWDGKITRLSGADLSIVQDVVINLPRSTKDHLTNSLAFDQSGALYISQGSNSAGGEPDTNWNFRPERLLSAAILKLDLDKLPTELPLNAFTTDDIATINAATSTSTVMSDGTYNPYANNAPLTIFASGVRNAYDLVWHNNGWLYVPTNGTAGNRTNSPNAPGTSDYPLARRIDGLMSIPDVPSLFGGETQKDWLFKTTGGSYHGHPNPYRGEFVLNHGGISYSGLPGQVETSYVDVEKYPNDLLADPNYREPAYDFGFNKSPNGVIEYKSNAFGGRLQGMLMVTRFSGQDDIIVLNPGQDGAIENDFADIIGLQGFDDPLDVIEDITTGNLYVSEYDRDNNGTPRLTLLRAASGAYDTTITASIDGIQETEDNVYSGAVSISLEALSRMGANTIETLTYSIDGGEVQSYEQPFIVSTAGARTIEVTATDALGFSFSETLLFTINGDEVLVEIENMTKFPGTDQGFPAEDYFTFHRIAIPRSPNIKVHDSNVMRIKNTGSGALAINDLTIDATGSFEAEFITNGDTELAVPFIIPPGAFQDVKLTYVGGAANGGAKGLLETELEVNSNAFGDNTTSSVTLHGAFMTKSEGGNEINAQQAIDAFGFQTSMLSEVDGVLTPQPTSDLPDPANIDAGIEGDLIFSPNFVQADPTQPIRALQMASFHGPGINGGRFIEVEGTGIVGGFNLFHDANNYQTLLPKNGNTINSDSENFIDEPFRIWIMGYRSSGGNTSDVRPDLLGLRVYKVKDRSGAVVPNEYIVIQDFITNGCGAGIANCDWNDNMLYIKNIRPQAIPTATAIPDLIAAKEVAFSLDTSVFFDKAYPGNVLKYTALQAGEALPEWMSLDTDSGLLTGTPPINALSAYTITVIGTDLNGLEATTTVRISTSEGLTANDDTVTVFQNNVVVINVLENDSHEDGVTTFGIDAIEAPLNGTAELIEGSNQIRYTSTDDFVGIDQFAYTIVSTLGERSTANVTVTVIEEIASAPIAVATSNFTTGDAPLMVSFSGSNTNPDAGAVTYFWDFGDGGTSTEQNPTHVYQATGSYAATLIITNNSGETDATIIVITVEEPEPILYAGEVISLMLVDAVTNQDIVALTDGLVLDANLLNSSALNIRAITNPNSVGSVVLQLSGATTNSRTESVAPYALFGDIAGIFIAGVFNLGAHQIIGTPYSLPGGNGNAGAQLVINFSITDLTSFADNSAASKLGEIQEKEAKPFVIYPNPAKDFVSIKIANKVMVQEFLIFNSNGVAVKQFDAKDVVSGDAYILPLQSLSVGFYTLVMKEVDGAMSSKQLQIE